jgi:L-iditol 2-dehydrogenase
MLGYWYNGAFAKFTIVPQDKIHLLPKKISFIEGALLEPLACVTHATMDQSIMSPTDIVLITGPGAIGLMALQVAKAYGAKVLISGTDYDIDRLEFARKLGADRVINIQKEDIYQIIKEETYRCGVDVVFECSGSSSAIKANMDLIKKRGKYNQIGLTEKMTSLDFNQICYKELKVTGSLGSIWTSWKNAISLVKNNKVDLKCLVLHQFPLSSWKEGFSIFENKKGIKIILKPV